MLEDLDTLALKVSELAQLAQALRTENQQLRAQLAAASTELETLRNRVDQATERLEAVLDRLPPTPNAGPAWNT
jgi:cell division protein ZapB